MKTKQEEFTRPVTGEAHGLLEYPLIFLLACILAVTYFTG